MKKSTATISLVLLGTAMALAGCSSRSEDEEDDRQGAGGHGGHVGTHFVPVFRGTGSGRGAPTTAAPSARAGFGGIGAGHAAS